MIRKIKRKAFHSVARQSSAHSAVAVAGAAHIQTGLFLSHFGGQNSYSLLLTGERSVFAVRI